VAYLIFVGKDERAVELAEPILRGRLTCGEIPHLTYAQLLLPLVRLGRVEQAAHWHRKGYRLVAKNREFLNEVARHLTFLVVTDNRLPAVQLLEKHLAWALETLDLARRFEFYLAARLLLDRLRGLGEATLDLRLPKAFPDRRDDGRYEVAGLLGWFDGELRDLADRFNARNGNDHFTQRIDENRRLTEQVSPHPLT
jgi:hypothetical protein